MVAGLYQSDSGDRTWTLIPNAPLARPRFNNSFDPSLNGELHCSNKFKSVPPPSHFDEEYVSKIWTISVGVLKGCLCVCYVIEGSRLETWLMEKYGEKETWRKAFSIDIKSYCGLSPQDKHGPIGFNACGEIKFIALKCSSWCALLWSIWNSRNQRLWNNINDNCETTCHNDELQICRQRRIAEITVQQLGPNG